MNARLRLGAAIALAASVFAGSPALAVDPGQTAPPFELPLMDGAGSALSDELFSKHEYTFIVFWRSSCPHCVEALLGCERFYRTYGGEDIAVLGINAEDRDRLAARGVIESNGITFPQAQDAGGMVSASYGIPFETFTLCLVGKGGAVLGVRFDPEGDTGAAMDEMLRQGESPAATSGTAPGVPGSPGAPISPGAPGEGKTFSYHGLHRIRLLAVDARGVDATGLYGEPVNPQRGVQYRLDVEASMRLAKGLRAGGLLRISNEGKKVLASGPDYLGSEWGSAFAEIEAAAFRVRIGYYDLSMTPFTLMRWDWDDSPRVGGDTGCGCGGPTAGAILVESLEELGPDLTVEGALASYAAFDCEVRLFYAIPRRAIETSYSAYRFGGEERARYSQEIAGFEWRWQRLDERTGSFWKAGAHAIASFENRCSVDFYGLDYLSEDPWISTRTLSFTAEAPLVRYARLRGEIIAWNDTDERGLMTAGGLADVSRRGGGGRGGIAIEKPLGPSILVDYLCLARGFSTPYSALSYEENTEGIRASARAPLLGDRITLSLFYKRLREADVSPPATERKQISLSGASLDLGLWRSLGAGLGWLEKEMWRDGEISPARSSRRGIVGELRYEFEKIGAVRLRYERIDYTETVPDTTESGTDMYSLYSSIEF
ncbi:MAG: TlpA disulfide reductase family protein [Candidatus Krumholzibacteriia bacterium]